MHETTVLIGSDLISILVSRALRPRQRFKRDIKLSVTLISPLKKPLSFWQGSKAEAKTGGHGMCISILKQAKWINSISLFLQGFRIGNGFVLVEVMWFWEHWILAQSCMTTGLPSWNAFTILPGKEHLELLVLIIWKVVIRNRNYSVFEMQSGHQIMGSAWLLLGSDLSFSSPLPRVGPWLVTKS